MNIENCQRLLELHRCGSISKAARNCFMSQQGFGKAIAEMERELGVRLIERSPQGIQFTQEGLLCVEHARDIVESYNRLLIKLPEISASAESERLPWLVTAFVTQTIIAFGRTATMGEACSFSSFLSREMPLERAIQNVLDSEDPLVLTAEIFPESIDSLKDKGLAVDPFINIGLGLLGKDVSGNLSAMPLNEIAGLPIVKYSDASLDYFIDKLFAGGPLRNVQAEFGNYALVIDFLRSEGGFALIDSLTYVLLRNGATNPIQGFTFAPIADKHAEFAIAFVYRADSKLTSRHRAIMNQTHATFAGLTRP